MLKNTTYFFDDEYFIQLQGTKIGTVIISIYANLSMGYNKIKLYDLVQFNYNLLIRIYFVENLKGILDPWETKIPNKHFVRTLDKKRVSWKSEWKNIIRLFIKTDAVIKTMNQK